MRNIPAISREHGDPRKFPGRGRRRICNEITLRRRMNIFPRILQFPHRNSEQRLVIVRALQTDLRVLCISVILSLRNSISISHKLNVFDSAVVLLYEKNWDQGYQQEKAASLNATCPLKFIVPAGKI